LAAQVARGEVNLVVVFIGGNDFINAMKTPDPPAALRQVGPRAEANLELAVATILKAHPDVKVVIITVPDIRDLPEFRVPLHAGRLPRAHADAATATIRRYNARIRALAAREPRSAVLDFDLVTRVSELIYPESLLVAGHPIVRSGPSDDPHHLFLGDVRHLGTVGQGLLAALLDVTIDAKFAAGVPPLSEREVLEFAEHRDLPATKLAVGPAVGGSDSPDPRGERGEERRVAVDDPAVCCRSRIVSAETVALGNKGGSSPGGLQATRPGIDLGTATAIPEISALGAGAAGCDEQADQPAGLAPARPYSRGKIPVILIHGLGSSPKSWAPMIEALEADPSLRERYQFWTFGYATCAPILYSAHLLRQDLRAARGRLDPDGTDPAFDHMILVGHSMGGLLAKMMAQDSRSYLWELRSAQPFEKLVGPPEDRDLLREMVFFKSQPEVRRLIFIATPHRGSRLDRGIIRRVGGRLCRLPDPLEQVHQRLRRASTRGWRTTRSWPTSAIRPSRAGPTVSCPTPARTSTARALNSLSTAAISARPTPSSSGRSGESSPSIFGRRPPRGWEDCPAGRSAKAVKFSRSLTRPGRRRTESGGDFVEAGRRRGGIARGTHRGPGTPIQALAPFSILQAGPVLADRGPPRIRTCHNTDTLVRPSCRRASVARSRHL
jgi:pimeloyl-ACP methyl ester carboxylesterase